MRYVLLISAFLIAQNIYGQVKFGTYTPLDTSQYARLKLYPNKKFEFYDMRDGSCWLWTNYIGNWKIIKDTIVFSWSYEWTENPDSLIKKVETPNSDITLTFIYAMVSLLKM